MSELYAPAYKLDEEQRNNAGNCLDEILTTTKPTADRSVLRSKGSFITLVSCTWQELMTKYSDNGRVEFKAMDAMLICKECSWAITGHQRYFPNTADKICQLYFTGEVRQAPAPRHAPVRVPVPVPVPQPEPKPEPKPEPTPRPTFKYPVINMRDKRIKGILEQICLTYNACANTLNGDLPDLEYKEERFNILINGMPGIGKTYGAFVLADMLGQSRETVHLITANSELVKIIGCMVPCIGPDGKPSKEMFYGTLTEAFMEAEADKEHIHIIVLDELDYWPNDVLAEGIYSVLASGVINTMETGRIDVPKNIIFMGIMNSNGMTKGKEFKDRTTLDAAILDRFEFKATAHWNHDVAVSISKGHPEMVEFIEAWNRAVYACVLPPYFYGSYRAIKSLLEHKLTGWDDVQAVESISRSMSKADLQNIIANIKLDEGNVYMGALKKLARRLKNESDWE